MFYSVFFFKIQEWTTSFLTLFIKELRAYFLKNCHFFCPSVSFIFSSSASACLRIRHGSRVYFLILKAPSARVDPTEASPGDADLCEGASENRAGGGFFYFYFLLSHYNEFDFVWNPLKCIKIARPYWEPRVSFSRKNVLRLKQLN